jgi:hypothetical protein
VLSALELVRARPDDNAHWHESDISRAGRQQRISLRTTELCITNEPQSR